MQKHWIGSVGSAYCCGYWSQHMLKLWACSHASCSTSYRSPPTLPKYSRACAMFWINAYQNCAPLCSIVTYRNLILQLSSLFFYLLLLIFASFISGIVSLFSAQKFLKLHTFLANNWLHQSLCKEIDFFIYWQKNLNLPQRIKNSLKLILIFLDEPFMKSGIKFYSEWTLRFSNIWCMGFIIKNHAKISENYFIVRR